MPSFFDRSQRTWWLRDQAPHVGRQVLLVARESVQGQIPLQSLLYATSQHLKTQRKCVVVMSCLTAQPGPNCQPISCICSVD